MPSAVRFTLFLAGIASLSLGNKVTTFSKSRENAPRELTTIDNGIIRVGIDSSRGGSITYLSPSNSSDSVINIHDMGREVQLSFYSGPAEYEPSPGSQQCNTSWRQGVWPWNPIGAGDVDGHSGSVVDVQKNDSAHTIYVKSIPLQWACDEVPCYCVFEKWIKLVGTAVVVDAKLTNARKDMTKYSAHGQELPAIYTIGSLYQTVAYNGTSPFTNGNLTFYPLKEPVPILATEHWAALVNDDNWGLGVFQPGTVPINSGFFGTPGKYGPLDDPTGYLGPNLLEILDWNITYTYQFHLVLGTLDDIRIYAYQNQHLIENCLMADFQFNASRQHWYYVNANDSGVPNGHWHVIMEQNDPQLYGPNCLWKTEDHPKLRIRASFSEVQASTEAQVYWNPYGIGEHFDETHSVSFAITADGAYHEYEVDLSQSAFYIGSAFGLRFDPVASGTKGAYVDIAYVKLV